jgi:exodeoxyribonuclease V gamma subunit
MLELTYSNRTEALLENLIRRVKAEREAGRGPWEPLHLVVPNPHFKEYLRQALATRLGVAANIRFSYLDGLWKDLLVNEGHRLLAFDLLRAGLLGVLGNRALLERPDMAPVRDYLGQETGQLKRVQLASELAKVFEEYQLSRPDWIQAWRAGATATTNLELETWQSRLWLEVVRTLDEASNPDRPLRHVTLLELIGASRFEGMKLPRAIHAFGLTHVAQAYQEVFQAFAPLAETTLHLYALNPCGEFWEDLDTGRNRLWTGLPNRQEARAAVEGADSEDPYRLAVDGPLALRLWGRPGREKIRLLNEVSDCDFTSAFELPGDATLLGQLQRDILLYREPACEEAAGPDDSVRCLACPSPKREAEAVASEVWRLMDLHAHTDRPLHFSEIAVVVPPADQEAYYAHLQAAFHDARQIPLVQGTGAFPILRETLEAVELLLELPTSGLTRAAVLRALLHPALRRRSGDLDIGAWERWSEEFGIVRGADRADWEGTYLAEDALNWDQGLKRLVLGAFMTEGAEFQLGEDTYRVNGARDEGPAAVFIAEVRGLCAEARKLARLKAEPQAWTRHLFDYLERWLSLDEGDEAEAVLKALDRIRRYLDRMFERMPEGLALPDMDFIAARHLALEALERLKDEQPANLARGVVVTSYAAMRAIPFRAIFLMGNGEGCFPTRNPRNALDLRSEGRRTGDVSQTEKEKYLFLEMLLSARDHLVLSYVALDELSGEPFEPSGLYKEFRQLLGAYLAPAWAPGKQGDPFLESHPLRRFDAAYFPTWFPGKAPLRTCSETAEKEARALWLGAEARRQGVVMPRCLGDLTLDAQASGALRAALDAPGVPASGSVREVLKVSVSDLRAFLECPLTGAAAVRLGLRKRDLEDRVAVENEPFESDFLESWALQREVALGALREAVAPEDVYARCIRRLQSEGAAPFGVFSKAEEGRNLEAIGHWVDYLRKQEGGPETWRLGGNRSGVDTIDHGLPPLTLKVQVAGQERTVELNGDLRVQLGGSLFLETGTRPSKSALAKVQKKALAAFVDHHVLACVDPGHGEHRARFVYEWDVKGEQEFTFTFKALTEAEARTRLQTWLEDLLNGNHAVLLPIEAVLQAWPDKLTPESILAFVDDCLNDSIVTEFSSTRGPVPDPASYPPPGDPKAIMDNRLKDYLDLVCGVNRGEA